MTSRVTSPLFRNCPNAEIYETELCHDCRNCERYESCIRKKAKVNRNRKAQERECKRRWKKRKKGNSIPVKTIFLTLILLTIFCVIVSNGSTTNAIAMEPDTISNQNAEKSFAMEQVVEEISDEVVQNFSEEVVEDIVEEVVQNLPEEVAEDIAEEVEQNLPEEATGGVSDEVVQELSEESVPSVTEEVVEEEITECEEPRISAYEPGTSYYYQLTKDDKKHIEKLLYKEARGECYKGKVAVAAVVLNRYFSDNPGFNHDSIYGVITQSGAFASISDVTQSMLDTVPDLAEAVEDACRGWDPTREVFSSGALFFYAPKEIKGYQKQIREGITVMEIGGHNFHIDFNN